MFGSSRTIFHEQTKFETCDNPGSGRFFINNSSCYPYVMPDIILSGKSKDFRSVVGTAV